MSKFLNLYNTFTKSLKIVQVGGQVTSKSLVTNHHLPLVGSFYICGPTIYSECHVGHAVTYIRADLFRRFMKSFFNVRLMTVMNITDIDDKILEKTKQELGNDFIEPATDPKLHPFNKISDKYYKSFINDMDTLNVIPADFYIKISQHVNLIVNFINKLEQNGFAYKTPSGDVRFRVSSLKNYIGRVDKRRQNHGEPPPNINAHEADTVQDFVLWKGAKPDEPVWYYKSAANDQDKLLPGRPGWHVQCSAIASAMFGNRLDFHFGGKDLIYPHHYNEEACCCAYHQLDTTSSLHVWASHWLHSGHLVLSDRKMSKSLGNVVPIKSFIDRTSVNALRLLCILTHYRTNVEYDENLLEKLKLYDHKISAFVSFLGDELKRNQEDLLYVTKEEEIIFDNDDITHLISRTQEQIVDGICNDFHLDQGLEAILYLAKRIYAEGEGCLKPKDLLTVWYLVKDWCETCGLEYGHFKASTSEQDRLTWAFVADFRQKVRQMTLDELKSGKGSGLHGNILKECDIVRAKLDELGFVLRDR